MAQRHRVLAVGGDRAVLVGLARAFQAGGSVFAAVNDPARLLDSALQFDPDLVLVFAHPSPVEAMQRVAALRGVERFARLAIVLVASLPPSDVRGVTRVMPDPSDVGDFASRLIRFLETENVDPAQVAALPAAAATAAFGAAAASPSGDDDDDVEEASEELEVEEIPALSSRLLLVDDDPALVRLFSVIMTKSGFEVLTGADGNEGLEAALRNRPDLIIADLNMPRLDGWGLLRAVRADHRIGETPLVFLSCHDDYRESLKALQSGAQDYVAKGGKLDALVARVRALLAPRDGFLGSIFAGERVHTRVQDVGLQWALRKMASLKASGVVHARDPFWSLQLGLRDGVLVHALAGIGSHRLEGAAALSALVVIRSGELLLDPKAASPEPNLQGDLVALVERAAELANATEEQALDQLLTQATRVEIDEPLYQLYEQWGPPPSRDIAALVHEGLTPREVIARSARSPIDVEDTLRDLVRRHVVRLTA